MKAGDSLRCNPEQGFSDKYVKQIFKLIFSELKGILNFVYGNMYCHVSMLTTKNPSNEPHMRVKIKVRSKLCT